MRVYTYKNRVGEMYGHRKIVAPSDRVVTRKSRRRWFVECMECGKKSELPVETLKVADCPCQRPEDLLGKIFGCRKAIKDAGKIPSQKGHIKQRSWVCECLDCGHIQILASSSLKQGKKCRKCAPSVKRLPRGVNLRNQIKSHCIGSAKKRKLSWNLPNDVFEKLIGSDCDYCGKPPSQLCRRGKGNPETLLYTGIDRVNNKIGYEVNNVVPCCKVCNRAKDVMGAEDFLTWVYSVQNHQDRKYENRLIGACA